MNALDSNPMMARAPVSQRPRARAEAAPTWHKHGLRHSIPGFLTPSGAAAEAGKWVYGRPGRRSNCDACQLVSQDGAGDHRQELSIVA